MPKNNYNANAIKHLSSIKAVRTRPGMYIGGVDKNGVFRIFKELVDNSVDEYLSGFNKQIAIWVNTKDHIITVADKGRGIPSGINSKSGISALTLAFTKLHAGGKFEDGVYMTSSGLHGVGIKATNALSSILEVWTSQKNKKWSYQRFKKGKQKTKVIKKKPEANVLKFYKKEQIGTVIRYTPDDSIFDTISTDVKRIHKEIKELSSLCMGLLFKIYIDDNDVVKYKTKEGIVELVESDESIGKVFKYSDDTIDIALNWTKADEHTLSFVNCSNTKDHGTHITALNRAVTNVLRPYTNKKVDPVDLRTGLLACLHYRMANPIYRGQTKDELTNNEVIKPIQEKIEEHLQKFFKKHEKTAKIIAKLAEQIKEERDKFKNNRAALKNIHVPKRNEKGILPDKLIRADSSYKPDERELFIVEGNSAGGSAKDARLLYQEILKLRGKIQNSSKVDISKLFGTKVDAGNKEVKDIITSIGVNLGKDCDPKKSRVGKVILLMDADVDGGHIANLVLCLIVNYMKPLVEAGKVYSVDCPLFRGSSSKKVIYDNSINAVKKQFGKREKVNITRFKGLGECNPDELYHMAMNPRTRKLVKLTLNDESESHMNKVMGVDSSFRKKILGIRVLDESMNERKKRKN